MYQEKTSLLKQQFVSIVSSYDRTTDIKKKCPDLTYFTTHYSFDLLVHKMEVQQWLVCSGGNLFFLSLLSINSQIQWPLINSILHSVRINSSSALQFNYLCTLHLFRYTAQLLFDGSYCLGHCLMLMKLRMYSRLRNKHRGTHINFWTFFQGLHSYKRG